MIENDLYAIYFQNLFTNLCSQNNIIKIKFQNKEFTTSRPLIISHSQVLDEIFGHTENNEFILDNNLDVNAFGEFINFVNTRNVDFKKCSFDNLLEVYEFCKAPLFRDYLAINAPSLDTQYDFLQKYESEGLPYDFLIIKLSSRVKEIVDHWDKVHIINSNHLVRILKKSNLSQLPPNTVFKFVNDTIQKRKDNPCEVIKVFNLTIIPFEKLLKLQAQSEKKNIHIAFLNELKINKDSLELKLNENEAMSNKLDVISSKNIKSMSTLEFKMIKSLNDFNEIQAITKIETNTIDFSLLLIGQEKVGKTSLIYRFFTQKFSEGKISQEIPHSHYNYISKLCNIDIIDVDGFYSFDGIRDAYVYQSQFFLFVCSPDVEDSLDYIQKYYKKICQMRNTTYVPSIVCLNKSDLLKHISDFDHQVKVFALSIDAEFISISSKKGDNINSIFDKAADKYSKHALNSTCYI